MEFSEKLKTTRTQANFTQNELAEKLAISRQAISNYEQGRSYPSIDILIEMSKLFNVSLDELLESGRKKMQMKRLFVLSTILFASIVANYISIYVLVRGNNFSSLNLVFGIALYFIPFMYLAMYFLFQYNPPKTINKIYGYRTKRSMQNQLTWNYSQNCFSDMCVIMSELLIGLNLVFAIISMFFNTLLYLVVGCVFLCLQAVCLLVPIYFVEKKLKVFHIKVGNN